MLGGLALDLGLRGGLANVGVTLGIAAVVVGLTTDRRLPRRSARWLARAAVLPAVALSWRASPWLVGADVAAVVALLVAATTFGRSGSVLDTTPGRVIRRLGAALTAAAAAPRVLRPLVPKPSSASAARLARVGRGLVVAVPILTVVVVLLASADAVFAGLLVPDVDPGPAVGHLAVVVALGIVVVAAVGSAAAEPVDAAPDGRYGVTEVVTMLGLAVAVLALFVLAQLVALTDAGDRLVASSGLSPAEYARSGFFQLCWATGILLAFLAVVRAIAAPPVLAHPAVRALGAAVPILALGLVAVSLRRLDLYDQAFGLTMLRLSVVAATVWFGLVLVLVALRNAGVGAGRQWVLAGAGTAALLLLAVANVADPEAFVVRHNLARAGAGAELDTAYLDHLSDDATAELAAAIAAEPDTTLRAELLDAIDCEREADGATAWNRAVRLAADHRRDACAAEGWAAVDRVDGARP